MSNGGLTLGVGEIQLNGVTRKMPKNVLVEIYQILLTQVCPERDYTGVTSCHKLLKILDLEFEPDDSGSEGSEGEPPPVSPPVSKPKAKTTPAPKGRKPVGRPAVKKSEPESESESESSSAEES